MIDLYDVLQVSRRAEVEVIRAAYRALARKYHPDFGGDARMMASINEAWAVLGDEERRAAYDAEPQAPAGGSTGSPTAATGRPAGGQTASAPPEPAERHGLAGHMPQHPNAGGSVIDFGRYAGWTVGSLVDHDPNYLEWLARTPIGRRMSKEIDEALARRATEAPAHSTGQQPRRRRAFR